MFNSNNTTQNCMCDKCRNRRKLGLKNNPDTPPMDEVEYYPRAFARSRNSVRCGYPLYTGIRR